MKLNVLSYANSEMLLNENQVACLPYTLPPEVTAAKEEYHRYVSSNFPTSDAQWGGHVLTSKDVLVVNAGVHHNVTEVCHTFLSLRKR